MDLTKKEILKNIYSLNQCFLTLGAPKEYCYRGNQYRVKVIPSETQKRLNIYLNVDGTIKPRDLLLKELKKYWRTSCKKYHPDNKPSQSEQHYNKQMKTINEAYDRGQELIQLYYKKFKSKRKSRTKQIIEAFTY